MYLCKAGKDTISSDNNVSAEERVVRKWLTEANTVNFISGYERYESNYLGSVRNIRVVKYS